MLTQIVQIKARIAGNSRTIRKIRNAEMDDLSRKVMFHELFRGSFNSDQPSHTAIPIWFSPDLALEETA